METQTPNQPSALYQALSQQLRRHWLRVISDEKLGVLTFPSSAIEEVASTLFAGLMNGGFATFVVSGRGNWDPQSYYYEAARRSAQGGNRIVRAFLLPHRQYLHDETLQAHWQLDTSAGIKVKMLYVGDVLQTLAMPPFGLDFGLWDDQIVCASVVQQGDNGKGPSEWRLSTRQEDIELAKFMRDELLSKATELIFPPPAEKMSLDLEEPMVQTAPLMDLLSGAVCSGSYLSPDDCSWYHGVWQYLRIFDLVSTPTWHPNLYLPELKALAQEVVNASVLISGTADYSTLAHVLHAFDYAHKPCRITVLDICQSPLILCQWYARRQKHRIDTVQADIFAYNADDTFDAIVTDAFLTRFNVEERARVIEKWAHLLRAGGRVVTTVRIHGPNVQDPAIPRADQVDKFRTRALQAAKRWQDFLPLTPEQLAIKAQRYAERMISHPIASADEIRDEFIEQGFSFTHFDQIQVKGELVPTTYLDLVARKN